MERVLAIVKSNADEKACDLTAHLSGRERLSMLEDLRQRATKVTHREYPRRLRRVLEIARRDVAMRPTGIQVIDRTQRER